MGDLVLVLLGLLVVSFFFLGQSKEVPGVKLPSVLYIKRIFYIIYLMFLSQR